MKVIVKPIVTGALGTVAKELVKRQEESEIRARVETNQTTALRSARILRRFLETSGDLLSLKLQEYNDDDRSYQRAEKAVEH